MLKRPSEYWRDHCYVSGSFLAPYEVALRHEVGLGNLLWGATTLTPRVRGRIRTSRFGTPLHRYPRTRRG